MIVPAFNTFLIVLSALYSLASLAFAVETAAGRAYRRRRTLAVFAAGVGLGVFVAFRAWSNLTGGAS